MRRAFHGTEKLRTHPPVIIGVQKERNTEKGRLLRADPGVPMPDIGRIVNHRSCSTRSQEFIPFIYGIQVIVIVDVVRKDEMPGSGVVLEVGRSLGWDRANENAVARQVERTIGGSSGIVATANFEGVDLEIVLVSFNNVRQGRAGKPKDFALGKLRGTIKIDTRSRVMSHTGISADVKVDATGKTTRVLLNLETMSAYPRALRGHTLFLFEIILGDSRESEIACDVGNCCRGARKASLEREVRDRGERDDED